MNPQILTTHQDVIATLFAPATTAADEIPDMDAHGDANWHPMVRGAVLLLRHTPHKSLRLVVGDHLIHVQAEGAQIVAVVVASANAINKSIHRMMRRSVGPWTAPRHERPIAPPRPRSKGVKAAKPAEPARPAMPPADPIEPAPVDILTETRRAVASDTPRLVRNPDLTPSIEMPRGDQW